MKTFLYAHTGSGNHGCEALVRSTLGLISGEPVLISSGYQEDLKYGMEKILSVKEDIITSIPKKSPRYIAAALQEKLTKKTTLFTEYSHQSFLSQVNSGDICLSIGGDNYCYAGTEILGDLNILLKKRGAKTVLWGCSIDPEAITPEMAEDLKNYDLITVREPLTKEALNNAGVSENVKLVADSAFLLKSQETDLPAGFLPGNTVGINLSPLILGYTSQKKEVLEGVDLLIQHILDTTDSAVALIPHVVKSGNNDYELLEDIYEPYRNNDRVVIVSDRNCMQLKYIISKCRLFIGARTHATIAAYSTLVPTLVIGYSVKSRGIATDLFGTDQHYVLPVQSLKSSRDLIDGYDWLEENADQIKETLKNKIPDYKKQALFAKKCFEQLNSEYMSKLADKKDCTGCTACASICPKGCIHMIPDEFGFQFPSVDSSLCIDCGMCHQVCPVLNESKPIINAGPAVYAAYSVNEKLRQDSSSGGVFSELASAVLNENGAVYGAAYDTSFNVKHICIEKPEDLKHLRGAKYAQSEMGHIFKDIKKRLENKQMVLFSGTPCQVGGLKAYLNKDYSNLVTVDFICHGVPSPEAWRKYIEYRKEMDHSSDIPQSINLRSKKTGWSHYGYSIEFKYDDGEYLEGNGSDLFMKLFIGDYISRESCSECRFKGYSRVSDITIGDFWGIWDIAQEMDDNQGTSVVLVHSEKGSELFAAVSYQLKLKKVTQEDASKYNPSLLQSSPANSKRNEVLTAIKNGSISDCNKLFIKRTPSKLQRLKNKLKKLIRH